MNIIEDKVRELNYRVIDKKDNNYQWMDIINDNLYSVLNVLVVNDNRSKTEYKITFNGFEIFKGSRYKALKFIDHKINTIFN